MLWSTFGTIGQFGANLIVIVFLARLLTPEDFGVVAAAGLVVGFLQKVLTFGLEQKIIQPLELGESQIKTVFTVSILLGTIGSTILVVTRSLFANIFGMPELNVILLALSITVFVGNVGLVPDALLKRKMQFHVLGIIQAASFIFGYGVVAIWLAVLGWGIWSLVTAQIIQLLVETTLLLINRTQSLRLFIDLRELRNIYYNGRSLTIARVVQYFAVQGDNLVVGRWLGAEALGLYGRAYRVMSLPANLFGDAIESVLFPALSAVQDQPKRLHSAFRQSTSLLALSFLPISALTIVLSPEIINVLLGSQWQNAILPLQALALGMYFRAAYKFSNSLMRAKGRLNTLALLQIAYASMILIAALIGKEWGTAGVGIGVTVVLAAYYLLSFAHIKQAIGVTWVDLLWMHIPGAAIGVLSLVFALFTANSFRQMNFSNLLVLVLTPFIVTACVMVCWALAMRFGFGRSEYVSVISLAHKVISRSSYSN